MTPTDSATAGLLTRHDDAEDLTRLLTPDGTRRADPELDPWIADVDTDRLARLYADLVVVRALDAQGVALQRQGEVGLWPPLTGQEAAQVGSARALRDDDYVFGSYREMGVAWARGVAPRGLVVEWRGAAASGWVPDEHRMAVPQIIIGAQSLHATGWAMGAAWDGDDAASIAYFGDGATSEGDVNEALVFAASFQAPVVFFCQNNHWAISEPVSLQSRQPLARRADGFGMPGVRVDGNDLLAVMAVTRRALDRARRGEGPTFIEAVTYRIGPHTTADDPTRYRTADEIEDWKARDPLARVLAHLGRLGADVEAIEQAAAREAEAAATELRETCRAIPAPEPMSVFDHIYAEPNTHLERQRERYARYLAMFDEAGDATDGGAR